jgi:hypothetical protein
MLPVVKNWKSSIINLINARWFEKPSVSFFSDFFRKVAQLDSLTGKKPIWSSHTQNWTCFKPDIEWLLTKQNFDAIINHQYDNKKSPPENQNRRAGEQNLPEPARATVDDVAKAQEQHAQKERERSKNLCYWYFLGCPNQKRQNGLCESHQATPEAHQAMEALKIIQGRVSA